MLTNILLAAAIIMPAAYVHRRCYFKGELEINHVLLFTFGYMAYWISPIALGVIFESTVEKVAGASWIDSFLNSNQTPLYLASCILIYCFFIMGDFLAGLRPKKTGYKIRQIDTRALFGISLCGFVLACGAIYRARSILFQGKYVSDTDLLGGTVASAAIFLFMIAVIYIAQSNTANLKQLLLNRYMLLFWPVGITLIVSGSRLYFISTLLMLFVYWTVYVRKMRILAFIRTFGLAVAFMGLVGTIRMPGSEQSILENIASEPLFTAFPLISFLQTHKIQYINYPVYLCSDLVNLVPSVLLPEKTTLMREIPDIYSPLGALNSFVSFDMNFGVLGSAAVLFIFSYGMRRLRSWETLWSKSSYVMISGWMAFAFFRDPFSVSIVKDIFEFSMLLPYILISIVRLVSRATLRVDAR